jgi:hypothetical protein
MVCKVCCPILLHTLDCRLEYMYHTMEDCSPKAGTPYQVLEPTAWTEDQPRQFFTKSGTHEASLPRLKSACGDHRVAIGQRYDSRRRGVFASGFWRGRSTNVARGVLG